MQIVITLLQDLAKELQSTKIPRKPEKYQGCAINNVLVPWLDWFLPQSHNSFQQLQNEVDKLK